MTKGEIKAKLRRALDANTERRGIIEDETSNGEDMAEESLEGETERRDEAEAQLGVAEEALKRAAKEAEQGRDQDRVVGGCRRNGVPDPGERAAVTTTTGTMTTPGILGMMERTDKREEEGVGAAATVTATSEVRNQDEERRERVDPDPCSFG